MARQRWRRTLVVLSCMTSVATASLVTAPVEAGPRRPVRVAQAGGGTPKRSTVASVIQKGRDMYDDARYEESIQTLSGVVVRADATNAERIEAYKLLAFNNIALGKNEEAD